MRTTTVRGLAAGFAAMLPVAAAAQVTTDAGTIDPVDTARFFNQLGYSPYAGHAYPMRPLWGEQHLHTSWSGDAIAAGTRVGPDEALQYAKGAEITSSTGQQARLSRRLGLRGGRRAGPQPRRRRLRQGRADGRRPAPGA